MDHGEPRVRRKRGYPVAPDAERGLLRNEAPRLVGFSRLEAARLATRERCAQIAENMGSPKIADRIRELNVE